jgi:hypothetical protein
VSSEHANPVSVGEETKAERHADVSAGPDHKNGAFLSAVSAVAAAFVMAVALAAVLEFV